MNNSSRGRLPDKPIKVSTVQEKEKLNDIYVHDSTGVHAFVVTKHNATSWIDDENPEGNPDIVAGLVFQKGPRKDESSTHGLIDSDLLEIVKYRLKYFQNSEYACEENAKALNCIQEALLWLNKRVEDRIERGVLGHNEK